MIKKKLFSDYLDLNRKPMPPPKKDNKIKFNFEIGDPNENSPKTTVEIKESCYNPNDYNYGTDNSVLLIAALFGGPLY